MLWTLLAWLALQADTRVIYIQPLGAELPSEDVALVKTALGAFYGLDVRLLDRIDLPKTAFYPPRQRFRAERLLDFLAAKLPAGGWRILGLTGVDISTTKDDVYDWGILGLGQMPGTASVISSFRCKKGAKDKAHARERLAKVAVHEIGHTLGLEHCPNIGCLMEDANGLVRTTDGEYDLCSSCRAKLGGALPETPAIPWRRPSLDASP